jgi:hypothetical protein
MKRYEESIKSILEDIDFDTLENSPHSIFILSPELKFIYFNKAWFDFANKNNGEPEISKKFSLNTPFEAGISGLLCDFYIKGYKEALREMKVWNHEYECSSTTNYRLYQQHTYPLKNGKGLIVVNSLWIDVLLDESFRQISNLSLDNYVNSDGFMTQCSNCRKTKRKDPSEVWDWVPSLVEKVQHNTDFSICPICNEYYGIKAVKK